MKYNETQYYYQGYSSHQTGLPYESSPHPIGIPASLEWCRGWRDAENDSRKRETSTETDNANQQFESLAENSVTPWGGIGTPPVGCECEFTDAQEYPWQAGTVKYISEHTILIRLKSPGSDGDLEPAFIPSTVKFRPVGFEEKIRTEEVAGALNKALGDIEKYPTWKDALLGVYGLVAAGKIPHIKLESEHE